MDLQERRQLDVAERVHKVRAKAHPWRYVFALVIAVAGAIAAKVGVVHTYTGLSATNTSHTSKIVFLAGTIVFFVLGMIAAFVLSGAAKGALEPLIGKAHAGIIRYVLVISLEVLGVSPRQLIVGGAVTGVLLGIAAQQSLANVFAGVVLLFASPFRVGDRVSFRAGALSGVIEGVVTDLSLTYVTVQTDEGRVHLPNSVVLAAAVMHVSDSPNANDPAP